MFVHLFQWVDDMAKAGADQYTFHLEATGKSLRLGILHCTHNYVRLMFAQGFHKKNHKKFKIAFCLH